MSDLRSIEIDFDVHKAIETERKSFSESPNAVLRRLLGIAGSPAKTTAHSQTEGARAWAGKGVSLPHGTQLRMEYNGAQHVGEIADGVWVAEGKTFNSPSAAAGGVALTKKGTHPSLDGWEYWWVKRPSDHDWIALDNLRK